MTTTTDTIDDDALWYEEFIEDYLEEHAVTVKAEPHSDAFNEHIRQIVGYDTGLCLLTGEDAGLRAAVIDSLLESSELKDKIVFITDNPTLGIEGVTEIGFPSLSDENPLADFDSFVKTVKGHGPSIVIVEDVNTPAKAFIASGIAHATVARTNKMSVLAEVDAKSTMEGIHKVVKLAESDPSYRIYDDRFMDEVGPSCGGDSHPVIICVQSQRHVHIEAAEDANSEEVSVTIPLWGSHRDN